MKQPTAKRLLSAKLSLVFTDWINYGHPPDYTKVSKIFSLSKEDTPFPGVGNIRTISVTPTITKLYEKVLLERLKVVCLEKKLVHPTQAGF